MRSYVSFKVHTVGWKSGLVITSRIPGGGGGAVLRDGVEGSSFYHFFHGILASNKRRKACVNCTLYSESIIV